MPNLSLQVFNAAFGQYLRWRVPRIERTRTSPYEFQDRWLDYLLIHGRHTQFGSDHNFNDIKSYKDFRKQIPIRDYNQHVSYINKMINGEKDILWPGKVTWFSKSSGTSSDRSKYLPVSSENLRKNHLRGGWDAMSLYYHQRPNASLFSRKNLVMGGSIQEVRESGAKLGDISGIMLANFPAVGRPFYTPSFETMLMTEYDKKLEAIAKESMKEDVGMIGGVPNWTMILLRKILTLSGASNISEIWPNLSLFTHGGINFQPYKSQFEQLIGKPIDYQEIYNASEGYFGLKDDLNRDDMLLLMDNGVYYEFLPQDQWNAEFPEAIPLDEVKINTPYGLVVSTNAGLWRYNLEDTIIFNSIAPFRFKIAGRTKQFINAFGEEVMVSNTDCALTQTCQTLNCEVTEYSIAPLFFEMNNERGAHEWAIEFRKAPEHLETFVEILDQNLQNLNGDYGAKRKNDLALSQIILNVLEKGSFNNWMKKRGKFGGQGKVPRLNSNRKNLEDLLNSSQIVRTYDVSIRI